jgi:hypothetical protein
MTQKEKYYQIIDDAHWNYMKSETDRTEKTGQTWTPLSIEEFIDKCKTDSEFSEKWGLKIKERELSLEERVDYKKKRDGIARTFAPYTHQMLDGSNIPTKLITVTYNDKTIESYENNS